jgi:serine protease Do
LNRCYAGFADVFCSVLAIFAYPMGSSLIVRWGQRWLVTVLALSASVLADAEAESVASLARQAAPGVVRVTGWLQNDDDQPFAEASGFFVDAGGTVLSVASVFTDAGPRLLCERFEIQRFDGRRLAAEVRAVDALLNLMLLSVDDGIPDGNPIFETRLNVARPGEQVVAVAGRPHPEEAAFASGQVKAQPKTSVYGIGLGDMYIDAYLDPPAGGDGGPLIDGAGKVIGIMTPNIHRPADVPETPGESHALPMRTARGFVKISERRTLSDMTWVGLAFRPLTPDEAKLTSSLLGRRAGVLVDFAWPHGPAGETDIRAGDVLVALDGKDIPDLFRLERRLDAAAIGDRLDLALLRGRHVVFRELSVEKRPRWAGFVPWRIE